MQVDREALAYVDDAVLRLVDGRHHHLHDDGDQHRDERHPEQQVEERRHELLRVVGQHVAEPDGADRDEDEVERLQVVPVLPLHVHRRAQQDVHHRYTDSDDRRQVELVVHNVRLHAGSGGGGGFPRRAAADVIAGRERAGTPLADVIIAREAVLQLLQLLFDQRHGAAVHELLAVARVVEAADERPAELEHAREHPAEVGENDEAERDADQRVHDGGEAAGGRDRRDVSVTCATHKHSAIC